ncbi:BA75_01287T0 [Komagataella pastoris]|uniref:BA75_01287T0 n=1 Tax=Komagataella pastoris TaxID=4922 RepID=A0A1B2J521_PICPA|nr:BA75_01287T0 [Komagataella pastoris]
MVAAQEDVKANKNTYLSHMFKHLRAGLAKPKLQWASSFQRRLFTPSTSYSKPLGVVLGAASSVCLMDTIIKNETFKTGTTPVSSRVGQVIEPTNKRPSPRLDGAFGGVLNYQQLAIGSFVGLGVGFVVGKLSSVLVFVTLSGYLLLQFLASRNIITIPYNRVVQLGSETINLKELVFEQPSFNLSFLVSFLIAAYNA